MLIATYTAFMRSHSQVPPPLSSHSRCCPFKLTPAPAPAQLLLMLQREAALVEEMRVAAADFRKVSPSLPVSCCCTDPLHPPALRPASAGGAGVA